MDYDDQLDRAMEHTPDNESQGERFQVPDPDVRQEGNTTVYENFQATVRRLDRDGEHVVQYLQNELGTSGHIDECCRARLTGSFDQLRIGDPVRE
jgi:translation initiation factor 2 subunit 2